MKFEQDIDILLTYMKEKIPANSSNLQDTKFNFSKEYSIKKDNKEIPCNQNGEDFLKLE